MQISFYEEYPTKKNLKKLKLINFPCRLFIAAQSIEDFEKFSKESKQYNKKVQTAYWPIVKNSYWVSAFSNTQDLENLFRELNKIKHDVLIDLEFPLLNKKLMIKNIFKVSENKRLIKSFLEHNKKRVTTAQFPMLRIFPVLKFLGLDYDVNVEKSFMWYSSMNKGPRNRSTMNGIERLKDKEKYSISLGTIARGALGNELILSPKGLEKDLEFVKKSGFSKVIVFRLGGLNKKYIQALNKFRN